jgi:hypothetical protein
MASIDVEAKFEERVRQAGLAAFFSVRESQFLDLGGDFFVEIVAKDSTKLSDFGGIVDEIKAGDPNIKTIVRAHWEVENIGDPVQAYNMQTGTPRTAVLYPVTLRSGEGTQQIWVEVTTLASMVLRDRGFGSDAVRRIIRDFVTERLKIGGSSYWDPMRFSQLEINGDTAEYISSKRSIKQ